LRNKASHNSTTGRARRSNVTTDNTTAAPAGLSNIGKEDNPNTDEDYEQENKVPKRDEETLENLLQARFTVADAEELNSDDWITTTSCNRNGKKKSINNHSLFILPRKTNQIKSSQTEQQKRVDDRCTQITTTVLPVDTTNLQKATENVVSINTECKRENCLETLTCPSGENKDTEACSENTACLLTESSSPKRPCISTVSKAAAEVSFDVSRFVDEPSSSHENVHAQFPHAVSEEQGEIQVLRAKVQELQLLTASQQKLWEEERDAYKKSWKVEQEKWDERVRALQLRLYISETRLKTYEDALEQHVQAVAENVAHPTTPTKRATTETDRPLLSRVLCSQDG
jgi:hypothetical protein